MRATGFSGVGLRCLEAPDDWRLTLMAHVPRPFRGLGA